MEYDNKNIIVIDNGTNSIKCGFSGEKAPRSEFPNVVGKRRQFCGMIGDNNILNQKFIGRKFVDKQKSLRLLSSYPVENGMIVNYDAMEEVLDNIFNNELKVNPKEISVLCSQPINNPKSNREKLTQIMFETFEVAGFDLGIQPELCLYASGNLSGMSCDFGESFNYFVPVSDGKMIYSKNSKLPQGGKEVTLYLEKMLNKKGIDLSIKNDIKDLSKIKEDLCYIAYDLDKEIDRYNKGIIKDIEYKMPDGQVINIGSERFLCPDILFVPSRFETEIPGGADSIFDTIMSLDEEIRKDVFSNIFISGGNSLFAGFKERLTKELKCLSAKKLTDKLKVISIL